MSKVALVFPAQPKHLIGENSWIHHGLSLIGAKLKESGHEVTILDKRLGEQSYVGYDYIGVSISLVDYHNGINCVRSIRSINPLAKIIVGGFCPSLFPERFNIPEIDHIIIGEGELTFLDIVNGVVKERIVMGRKPNLDTLPFALREEWGYQRELDCGFAPFQPTPHITMISGRGCPYQCTYCQPAESQLYGKFRMRKPEHCMEELRDLYDRYEFKSITWWDDTFTINEDWVNRFCDLYDSHFNADMACCSRADIICNKPSMVKRLAKSGVKWFVIGIESGSQKILDYLKKGTTVEQNREAIKICHENGIKVFGTFMLGLPTETNSQALETMLFIRDNKIDHPSMFFFTPIPGTEIYKDCIDNDLIIRTDEFDIDRTNSYSPKIKGVDYGFLKTMGMSVLN